ncbi:hypothetical protein [Chryseobacterium sp. RLHN22]|uniref:hypothetical protein n=1 Tax=Chryseobacterium sp. RLHN22 TaxID=3437885 RepID=UPI003D9B1588
MRYISIYQYSRFIKSIEGKFLNVLFLLFSLSFFSQTTNLRVGIKAGWNYSNVSAVDENGEKSGYISGIIDEVYGAVVFEKQISMSTYLQVAPTISFTDAVTFIELPIYYKYNFYKDLSLLVGPKINYIPDEQNNNFYYFRNRFGFSADIGVEYKLSKRFNIEGTFSKGFTKQFDQLALTYYGARRDVYRVGLTYYFVN